MLIFGGIWTHGFPLALVKQVLYYLNYDSSLEFGFWNDFFFQKRKQTRRNRASCLGRMRTGIMGL
jgi:hypothetical protein